MAFFNLSFLVHGTPQLAKLRGVLQGIGQQSYKTFDALARSMSTLDKATGRTLSRLAMFAGGGGLAYGAMKTVNYSLYQSNSMITTNRIMLEELVGTATAAKGYIKVVQDLSGSFGTDMSEMMTASRGLIQMFTQIGSRGNQPAAPAHLEKMLKLVTAVSLLDTENRGLAYTAFAFKEGLQGVGQGDWRSMKNRLEINLGKEREKAITAAVKAGNMDDVVRLFDEAFKAIGINADSMIKRIMGEGLTQNITRFMTYVSRTFQMIGESSYIALAKPFARLNTFIARQFEMGDGKKIKKSMLMGLLEGVGEDLNQKFITPFRIAMDKFTESLKIHLEAVVLGVKSLVGGVFNLFAGMATPFFAFLKGLFGITTQLDRSDDTLRGFGETAEKIGNKLSKIGLYFRGLADAANGFALAINSVAKAFLHMSSILPSALVGAMFGGIKGGVVGAGAGAMAGGMVSGSDKGSGIGEAFNAVLMTLFGVTALKSLFGGSGKSASASDKTIINSIKDTAKTNAQISKNITAGSVGTMGFDKFGNRNPVDVNNLQYATRAETEAVRRFQNYESTFVNRNSFLLNTPNQFNNPSKLQGLYGGEGMGRKYGLYGQTIDSRIAQAQAAMAARQQATLSQASIYKQYGFKAAGEGFVAKMNSPVTGAGLNTLFMASLAMQFKKLFIITSTMTAGLTVAQFSAGLLAAQFGMLTLIVGGAVTALALFKWTLDAKADQAEAEERMRMAKYDQEKLAKYGKDTSGLLGGVGLGTYKMAWNRDMITQLVKTPEQLLASMLYMKKHASPAESAAYNERMDRLYRYKLKNPQNFTNEEGEATGGNAWGSVATHDKWGKVVPSPSEMLNRELTVNVKGTEKGLADKYREYFEELLIKAHPELKKSTTLTKNEAEEKALRMQQLIKSGDSDYNTRENPQ